MPNNLETTLVPDQGEPNCLKDVSTCSRKFKDMILLDAMKMN